jgi:hypothetical protein
MDGYTNPYAGMTKDEMEAQFTKEDPRYPVRKAALEALETHVGEWINDYEWTDGDNGYYKPSATEQALLHDAFAGLTSDEEYRRLHAAWRSLCGAGDPAAAAEALHGAVVAVVGDLMKTDHAADSEQGRVLVRLAEAVEAYECATLPPPLGKAPHSNSI